MLKLLVINGPNLNMLGKREPEVYGSETLTEIEQWTAQKLKNSSIKLDWFQSNIEGEIVSKIQEISKNYQGLIINPGAYAHTSVAILDALKTLSIPVVEVHLSQVYKRESFRQTLLTAQGVNIIMSGLKKDSYNLAAHALQNIIEG